MKPLNPALRRYLRFDSGNNGFRSALRIEKDSWECSCRRTFADRPGARRDGCVINCHGFPQALVLQGSWPLLSDIHSLLFNDELASQRFGLTTIDTKDGEYCKALILMVSAAGLEPATHALKA